MEDQQNSNRRRGGAMSYGMAPVAAAAVITGVLGLGAIGGVVMTLNDDKDPQVQAQQAPTSASADPSEQAQQSAPASEGASVQTGQPGGAESSAATQSGQAQPGADSAAGQGAQGSDQPWSGYADAHGGNADQGTGSARDQEAQAGSNTGSGSTSDAGAKGSASNPTKGGTTDGGTVGSSIEQGSSSRIDGGSATDSAKNHPGHPSQGDPRVKSNDRGQLFYVVQKGDTLSKISGEVGVSVDQLAWFNGLEDVNLIYTGEALRLPIEGGPTPSK